MIIPTLEYRIAVSRLNDKALDNNKQNIEDKSIFNKKINLN